MLDEDFDYIFKFVIIGKLINQATVELENQIC